MYQVICVDSRYPSAVWGSVSISAIIQYFTQQWKISNVTVSNHISSFSFSVFPFSILPFTFLLTSYIFISFSLSYLSLLSFLYHSSHTPSYVVISFSLMSFSFLYPSFILTVSNFIFILCSLLHSFCFKKLLVTGINFFELSFVNGK